MGDLGKLNGAKGFKNLPKVQEIAQSGHTDKHVPRIYIPPRIPSLFWEALIEWCWSWRNSDQVQEEEEDHFSILPVIAGPPPKKWTELDIIHFLW